MSQLLKDLLWPLYRHTGPLYALTLQIKLVLRHGIAGGILNFKRLPPGDLAPASREMARDQHYFLKRGQRYGNVFKCQTRKDLLIVIIGNKSGMKFISENEIRLSQVAKELKRLFPGGHLRAMKGKEHRHYRRSFIRAMDPEVIAACDPDIRNVVRTELLRLARNFGSQMIPTPAIISTLRSITTRSLLRVLLGLDPYSSESDRLVKCYDRFSWGYVPAHKIGEEEAATFAEIQSTVHELVCEMTEVLTRDGPDSILSRLVGEGVKDDTTIGNLLYMIEAGRFDVFCLLRWVTKYLTESPSLVSHIKEDISGTGSEPSNLSMAVVMETLRCNQSEMILRILLSDTDFDGCFLPAGSTVRICLWEQHKDANVFPQPFRFDPHRFLSGNYSLDEYAPFGLDQHRCIGADLVVRLSAIFVEEICRNFDLEIVKDGDPVLGVYHWEPSTDYAIRLLPNERIRALE